MWLLGVASSLTRLAVLDITRERAQAIVTTGFFDGGSSSLLGHGDGGLWDDSLYLLGF